MKRNKSGAAKTDNKTAGVGSKNKLDEHEIEPMDETIKKTKIKSATAGTQVKNTGDKLSETKIFKAKLYQNKGLMSNIKSWKNLKSILASEKASPSGSLYHNINAGLSRIPKKKYSDISGLPALYTEPNTKLCFYDSKEFHIIHSLSQETITGLQALRKATLTAT